MEILTRILTTRVVIRTAIPITRVLMIPTTTTKAIRFSGKYSCRLRNYWPCYLCVSKKLMRPFSKETFMDIKQKIAPPKDRGFPADEPNFILDPKNRPAFVLVLLAILLIAWSVWQSEVKREESNIIIPKVTKTPKAELGKITPQNIPLNGKASVVESYSAEYPNSTAKQSTIVFTSFKTADENFDYYSKWAKDNDWQIVNSSRDSAVYSLSLKKPSERMVITINKGTITISYVNLNK